MTSDKSSTSVRRRRIAGERSRPAERPAPKPAAPPRRPRKPPSAPSATGWRPDRQTVAWFVPLCVLSVVAAGFAIVLGALELTDDDPLDAAAREDAVAPAG